MPGGYFTEIVRRMLAIITVMGVVAALVPAAGSSAGTAPRFTPVMRGFGPVSAVPVRRFSAPQIVIPAPLLHGGGACEIASGRCSLTPCVDRIESSRARASLGLAMPVLPGTGLSAPAVPAIRIAPPAIRHSAQVCRHPAPILISSG